MPENIGKRNLTVLATICIIFSLLFIPTQIGMFIETIQKMSITDNKYLITVLFRIIMVLIELGFLIGAIGIYKVMEWARKLILFTAFLKILYMIWGGISIPEKKYILIGLFWILPIIGCYVFLIYYLNKTKIRGQFK